MKRALIPVAVMTAQMAQADPMTDALCTQIVEAVQQVAALTIGLGGVEAAGEACVIRDVVLDMPEQRDIDFTIRNVMFSARGVEAFLLDQTPLQAVQISVEDLRILPRTGDPFFDYMFDVQQARNTIDVEVNIAWDAATMALNLDRFFIDFQGDNSILVTQVVTGVDLRSLAALEASQAQMRVTDLRIEVETNGLFEGYAFGMLLPLIQSAEGAPQEVVAELRAQGVAGIEGLPEAIFDGASRAALTALIEDMPHPGGTVSAHLMAEPGIGVLQMAAVALERRVETALAVFDGVTIDVTYDRVPLE